MGEEQNMDYQIKFTETPEPSYMDGFADGYSRAWQECWEYMREISSKPANEKEESKSATTEVQD